MKKTVGRKTNKLREIRGKGQKIIYYGKSKFPWEKDPGDTEENVTLWGSLSPHVSVVVPTDPCMRGFALEVLQESTTCHLAVTRSCALR